MTATQHLHYLAHKMVARLVGPVPGPLLTLTLRDLTGQPLHLCMAAIKRADLARTTT